MSAADEYLHASVAPVLRPLLKKVVEDRPHDVLAFLIEQLTKSVPPRFPVTPEEVTTNWLSKQLGEEVLRFEIAKVGNGFTSDAYKLTIMLKSDQVHPKTLILKLPSALGIVKQKIHQHDCKVEVMFYRDLAKHFKGIMKLPKCKASFIDERRPWRWCILMEDLTADSNMRDFADVLLHGSAAESLKTLHVTDLRFYTIKILEDLAKMHAHFWQSPLLDTEPIFKIQPEVFPGCKFNFGFWSTGKTVFDVNPETNELPAKTLLKLITENADLLKGFSIVAVDSPYVEWLRTSAGTDQSRKIFDYISRHFNRRPMTLIHSDAHLGNVFYHEQRQDFTWIDFQMLGSGSPAIDLGQALTAEPAADHKVLAKRYYQRLLAHGPVGLKKVYSFDDLWQDYRYHLYIIPCCACAAYLPGLCQGIISEMKQTGKSELKIGVETMFLRYLDHWETMGTLSSLEAEILAQINSE